MRVAIVNDSAMAVEALRRAILSSSEHQISWVAVNGLEAVAQCKLDRPELILMDLMMPLMDGVEATRHIMAQSPCPILITTASVKSHSTKVFEALGAGALDVVSTPAMRTNGSVDGISALLYKIGTLGHLTGAKPPPKPSPLPEPPLSIGTKNLIAIGASAGGPAALAAVLGGLPTDLNAGVVIVQHLDAQFAPGLTLWLEQHSTLPVRMARENDTVQPGVVLLAGTNDHLIFKSNGSLGYTQHPVDCSYRPSIDVFFDSVRQYWKGRVAAAILTGMGRDGAQGLKSLRESGALTIAQAREGCVVYGMPKAAAELGAAMSILPLERIALALAGHFAAQSHRLNQ